jgi:hypothetical protein
MRLPNGQGLPRECRVFRNCRASPLTWPPSQFKESTIVARPTRRLLTVWSAVRK